MYSTATHSGPNPHKHKSGERSRHAGGYGRATATAMRQKCMSNIQPMYSQNRAMQLMDNVQMMRSSPVEAKHSTVAIPCTTDDRH